MNIFDIGILLLLIMFAIIGWKQGVIREGVSLVGIVIVFFIAFSFKATLGKILCLICPFFKFSGPLEGMVTINIFVYQLIAFLIIFSLLMSLYAIFLKISKLLQKVVNLTLILWLPSKIAGAVIGLIKGYIVLFAVLLVLMIPLSQQELYTNSSMVSTVLYHTPILSAKTDKFTTSFNEVYELSKSVAEKETTTNDANLKALDIMLKYDIVNKNTIEQLIKLHKLDSIQNIDTVLDQYE